MSLDTLIQEDLVSLRCSLISYFKTQHPQIFMILERIFEGTKNKVGLQVTENDKMVGQYTFILDGINVVEVKSGVLESELHHPFLGVVKPLAIIERTSIEKMIQDEQFQKELFPTLAKHLPNITVKFMS